MFSLFELAKVVDFSKDSKNNSDIQYTNISNHAWKDVGKRTALALNFSNGYLVLWHAVSYQKPVMRKVPWFPNRPILAMCYDFSGTWLLCCVRDAAIILPALSLLEPSAVVNKIWPTNDSSEVNLPKLKGLITSCCWWHTHQEESIALLATDHGVLYFVNLVTEQVREIRMAEHVSQVTLVRDHAHATTSALITSKSNRQWKLPLERKAEVPRLFENEIVWNTKTSPVNAQFKRLYTYKSILHRTDELLSEDIKPKHLSQFSPDVHLSVQNAKGRHMVAAYNIKTHVYELYEGDLEHSPLYVYHLPAVTDDVLVTDRLLFMTSVAQSHVLTVAANQLAEASGEESKKHSIIQHFVLPEKENILAVYKHSFPTNWHQLNTTSLSDADAALQRAVKEHSVLDGCLILTNKTAYICRPRISPEFLFLKLVEEDSDFVRAERLAYILGLDLNLLYKLSAERTLAAHHDCSLALAILERAVYPTHLERFELLLQYGFVKEAMPILEVLITSKGTNELPPEDRPKLARTAVMCFVHQIIVADESSDSVRADFRKFLFTNFHLDKQQVLQILLHYGMSNLFVDFAQERDIFLDAIKVLLDDAEFDSESFKSDRFPQIKIPLTLERTLREKLKIEMLLQLLDIHELLLILEDDTTYCDKLAAVIERNLLQLSEQKLLHLATILDMSKAPWKKWAHLALKGAETENTEEECKKGGEEPKTKSDIIRIVINLFLSVVIYLNHRRIPKSPEISIAKYSNIDKKQVPCEPDEADQTPIELLHCRPTVVACGENSTALVRNGDLYTWGCAKDGRLGQGSLDVEMDCTPHVLRSFYDYGIRVVSVACGSAHCLALSAKGVYGWGNSRYGQVGTGVAGCTYITPVYIEALDKQRVTSVVCGQYHSAAVTADFKLYTWGWGVHGQLGHGTPTNNNIPQLVTALHQYQVVMATAGHAHTTVLTAKGCVYAFGCGNFGQLGNNSTNKQTLPIKVKTLTEPVAMISTKYFHNLAMTHSGKLYCWGASPLRLRQEMLVTKKSMTAHKTKTQTQNKHLKPSLVDTKHLHSRIVKLCCGASFSAVLTESGDVYTWGANTDGQLGTGTNIAEGKLHRVSSLHETRMVTIATGSNFMVALDTSGDLHTWGNNDKGQLGMRPRSPALTAGQKPLKSAPATLGHPYVRLLAGPNNLLEPTRIDASALSRVRNLRNFKEELARAAMAQEWWLDRACDSWNHATSDSSLPALVGSPEPRYPPLSLVLTLHHLAQWTRPQWLLELTTSLCNWHAATAIAVHTRRACLAFHCHIEQLGEFRSVSDSDYVDHITAAVRQHVVWHTDGDSAQQSCCVDGLCLFLRQVLGVWLAESLPLTALEHIVSDFSERLAIPFMLNLFGAREWISKLGAELCDVADCSKCTSDLEIDKNNFSSEFMLIVLQTAMKQIQSGQVKSTFLDQEVNSLFHLMEKTKLSVKLTEAPSKTSPSAEFTSNLSVMHVTKDELVKVTDTKQQSDSSEVIFFTCSHHCKRSVLQDVLVPDLQVKLTDREPPLVKAAAVLTQQYLQSSSINLACPQCVYTTIAGL